MDRYTCRLVDDNHVIIFVYYTDRLRSHRRLMSMQCVGYYVAVPDDCVDAGYLLSIDDHTAALYGIFLKHISQDQDHNAVLRPPYIVLFRSVSKFISEDVEQLSSPPSFFAVRVVCIMIRVYFSKAIFEIVGSRPWITRGCDHFWRGAESLVLRFVGCRISQSFDRCQCHVSCVQ